MTTTERMFMPTARHLEPLVDLFRRAEREPVRACVSLPPRHGKTATIKDQLIRRLRDRVGDSSAYVTYSDQAAAACVRSVLAAAGRTAGLIGLGVGASLTGDMFEGIVVIDDPFKAPTDARSPAHAGAAWRWFRDALLPRLARGASVVIVQSRMGQLDFAGQLERSDLRCEFLNLPALAEDADPLRRPPGMALWEGEVDGTYLRQQRRVVGVANFTWLYQGRAPREEDWSIP